MNSENFLFYQDRIVNFFTEYDTIHFGGWERNTQNLREKKQETLELSKFSVKNIEKKLTSFLTALQVFNLTHPDQPAALVRKPIFVTVTLSGKTEMTHQEIKRLMLQRFLETCRYNYSTKEHFWKAELQKNGNIHFHIITDHYINKYEIQKQWNVLQKKYGITEKYFKEHHTHNPPSTHVRAIADMEKSVRYVLKYVTKDESNGTIKGNVYRFSRRGQAPGHDTGRHFLLRARHRMPDQRRELCQ